MKSVSLTPAQLCLLETFAGVQSQKKRTSCPASSVIFMRGNLMKNLRHCGVTAHSIKKSLTNTEDDIFGLHIRGGERMRRSSGHLVVIDTN